MNWQKFTITIYTQDRIQPMTIKTKHN